MEFDSLVHQNRHFFSSESLYLPLLILTLVAQVWLSQIGYPGTHPSEGAVEHMSRAESARNPYERS